MLDTIVRLLQESGVSAWELNDVKTEGWEFYFIRHELDQNRITEVRGTWLTTGTLFTVNTAWEEELIIDN